MNDIQVPQRDGQIPYDWQTLDDRWSYFTEQDFALPDILAAGGHRAWCWQSSTATWSLTRVYVPDGRLVLAAVLAVESEQEGCVWRASYLLDDLHLVHEGFDTQQAAKRDAEETLSGYLLREGLLPGAYYRVGFDTHVEEVLAMLTLLLDAGWQVAHVTAYPGLLLAVCINDARTALLDLAFPHDFRERGPQDVVDRSVRYMLDRPPADQSLPRSLFVPVQIRRSIVMHLLERQVPFSVEPVTERLCRVSVTARDLPALQEKLEQHTASSLVDGNDEEA
jgi:hypothetical protein